MKKPLVLWLVLLLPARAALFDFHQDGILGTSMDLYVDAASPVAATHALQAALAEVERLRPVFSRYDPHSEVVQWTPGQTPSATLLPVLRASERLEVLTDGVYSPRTPHPDGSSGLDLDANAKGHILDLASECALHADPGITSVLLDIGGDLRARGPRRWPVRIADPRAPAENGPALATLGLRDQALATSGNNARPGHLRDRRNPERSSHLLSASVLAPDALTADGLASALYLLEPKRGLDLLTAFPGAEALLLTVEGSTPHSAAFPLQEPPSSPPPAPTVDLRLQITGDGPRPYVAVWVEDAKGTCIRTLAVWGKKPKHQRALKSWTAARTNSPITSRATRPNGEYRLQWDGCDEDGRPVAPGPYTFRAESAREEGPHCQVRVRLPLGTGQAEAMSDADRDIRSLSVRTPGSTDPLP